MAYIIETPNPFEPVTEAKRHSHRGGISIRDWLQMEYPGFVEFDVPTLCLVNGRPALRSRWGNLIGPNDVINFITLPQGPLALIVLYVIIIVAAIVLALVIQPPALPGETPASDPVYTNKGRGNTVRLGEPIECNYGRNRIYPSLAAIPFYQYDNNDQFQYSLFCIGQGVYEINEILIGDTDISNYQEVEYEVIEPGDPITLLPTNVYTSPEAGGQELFGPNEDEYSAPGWQGPFAANNSGTTTTKIQVDISAPKGLYRTANSGGLQPRSITLEIEARLIDDAGSPLGAYANLSFSPVTVTLATTTPQRRTYEDNTLASGRYEVRVRRTSSTDTSYRSGHDAVWEGMRAYIEDTDVDFGDVTLLAVVIRATNNLNSRTQTLFNLNATRKLPYRESDGTFGTPVPTRSIMWAFVDVFRAQYGGRVTDAYFDWDVIEALDSELNARGDYFDWIFRDPITVWEAAAAIARVGRSAPLLDGSKITAKRDGELSLPVTMFTPDNILDGSFSWSVKLWDLDEFDSVKIEYIEVNSGYRPEQVLCTLPGGTTNNPRNIKLIGCSDRQQAYQEGLFTLASERYLRENVSFETGLEGHIPQFGDLIAVAHDIPNWGQSGFVVSSVFNSGGTGYIITLSEPLVWDAMQTYQLMLRGSKSEILGPFTATATSEEDEVEITASGLDFQTDGLTEPMIFLFGITGNVTEYMKVVRIEPRGNEVIAITAVNYSAIIHTFDGLTAPPLDVYSEPPTVPDLPVIARIYISQIDNVLSIIQVSWSATFGAQSYIIQTSQDGVAWDEHALTTQTSIQMQVVPGLFYVRVAAINTGQGPWKSTNITIGHIAGLENSIPFLIDEWEVRWGAVLNAVGYQVSIYNNSTPSAPVLRRQVQYSSAVRDHVYDLSDALTDSNVNRDMLVEVDPLFQDTDTGGLTVSGYPASLELTNAVPTAPTNPTSALSAETSDVTDIEYSLNWEIPVEGDLIGLKLWVEATEGFDPEVATPVLDVEESGIGYENLPTGHHISVALDSYGEHGPIRWRVAVFDVWGNEITTNITAEQTIHATSGWVA